MPPNGGHEPGGRGQQARAFKRPPKRDEGNNNPTGNSEREGGGTGIGERVGQSGAARVSECEEAPKLRPAAALRGQGCVMRYLG